MERFAQDPRLPGAAEAIVYNENLAAQFLGDLDALDRLEALALQFARVDDSSRAALVQAEIASTVHRFADARDHLARAASLGAPREEIDRHLLSIDQACGVELDTVLAARRRIAAAKGRLEDLVPLGAVLADLERFAEAELSIGRRSPRTTTFRHSRWRGFVFSSACCGESSSPRQTNRAALWYRRAIAYVPGYVKARVHLAEIYASQGQPSDAEALLMPALRAAIRRFAGVWPTS